MSERVTANGAKVIPLPIFDGKTATSYALDLCAQLRALNARAKDGDDKAWEEMDPIMADLRELIESMRPPAKAEDE